MIEADAGNDGAVRIERVYRVQAPAEAHLENRNVDALVNEFAADQVALFDYALKAQVASIARVADAVRRAG